MATPANVRFNGAAAIYGGRPAPAATSMQFAIGAPLGAWIGTLQGYAAVTVSGPSSGTVNVASAPFTIGSTSPVTTPFNVTLAASGMSWSPSATVTLTSGAPTAQITPTPTTEGAKTITVTNTGGLDNPTPLTFTANAAPVLSGIFEPAIANESQPTQFLSVDTGSGPSFRHWNTQLAIPWVNETTGDFTDANDTPQGTVPFASVSTPTGGQYYSLNVATLISRALASGENKGVYLKTTGTGSAVTCNGRLGANPPTLTVITTVGTFICACRATAQWVPRATSAVPSNTSVSFGIQSNWLAIVQFDLSAVSGTVTTATMQIYVAARFGSGTAITAYEANPPRFNLGAGALTPVVGLAAEVGEAGLTGHPDVLMAGDFAGTTYNSGTQRWNSPKLFPSIQTSAANAPEIIEDPEAPGTIMWRGKFTPVYTGQDPNRQSFNGEFGLMLPIMTDPLFSIDPATYIDEAYYRQYLMLEDDFTTSADGNKMGLTWDLRFGFWNNGWQPITGNGGARGTGLAQDEFIGLISQTRRTYHGHMERMESGQDPGDGSPYADYRPLIGYNYHLDQLGPFPGGLDDPNGGAIYSNLVLSKFVRGRWYCIEQHIKLNTVSGTLDSYGNGTANPDGLLETWINGVLVDRRTTYRWRRNAAYGIQGINANWYMGGVQVMTNTMHYRLNNFVLAKRYIGPRVRPLPAWVPASGGVAELTVANGGLVREPSTVAMSGYGAFYQPKLKEAFSDWCFNPYMGAYGEYVLHGGGHANTNENTVLAMMPTSDGIDWRVLINGTAHYGNTSEQATANATTPVNSLPGGYDSDWCEYQLDGKPASRHAYGSMDVIGPENGGEARGTYEYWMNAANSISSLPVAGAAPHRIRFTSDAGPYSWERIGATTLTATMGNVNPWVVSCYVPDTNRVYLEANASTSQQTVKWIDRATNTRQTSGGTMRLSAGNADSCAMFYVPSRQLLIFADSSGGNVRLQCMNVAPGVTNPGWQTTVSLSQAVPVQGAWGIAGWCPDNNRIVIGGSTNDATGIYEVEIPTPTTGAWTVTRRAFTSGSITSNAWTGSARSCTYGKGWTYNPAIKCFLWAPYISTPTKVYAYRPHGV